MMVCDGSARLGKMETDTARLGWKPIQSSSALSYTQVSQPQTQSIVDVIPAAAPIPQAISAIANEVRKAAFVLFRIFRAPLDPWCVLGPSSSGRSYRNRKFEDISKHHRVPRRVYRTRLCLIC